jgi:ankyrin repeat protein
MRADMSDADRAAHDEAWGLNFGDFNDIEIARDQKQHPENLIEHPMSKNMRDKLIDFLKQHPGEITQPDDAGYTLLHREAIAGNLTSIEALLAAGADKNQKTRNGKTALDFARQLDWPHIVAALG